MNADALRALQAPLKTRYKEAPTANYNATGFIVTYTNAETRTG